MPDSWNGFTVRYRLPDRTTVYEIAVQRVTGETSATLDGTATAVTVIEGATRISITRDGGVHEIHIALGDDVRPRYAERRSTVE